jgi:hypothetical protein
MSDIDTQLLMEEGLKGLMIACPAARLPYTTPDALARAVARSHTDVFSHQQLAVKVCASDAAPSTQRHLLTCCPDGCQTIAGKGLLLLCCIVPFAVETCVALKEFSEEAVQLTTVSLW